MAILGQVIGTVLWLYSLVLLGRMILSWVPMFAPGWTPRGPLLILAELIYTLTDRPLRFLQRFIPNLNLGAIRLDLSFIVLWLSVIIAMRVNAAVFATASLGVR